MLKRTPGKWKWTLIPKDGTLRMVIVVEDDNHDEGDLEPLMPTVGDFQLVTNAPEMYELLWQVSEEIDEALHQGVITEGIYRASRKILALLSEVNVERHDTKKEGRPC